MRATYRLQLTPELDLEAAAGLVPYLAELGVSHLYASPYLQAAPGSTHGYDVVDPTRVSRELGGEAARERLVAALAERGMGHVLDIVPNHMAARAENPWWWELLESGPWGGGAALFDVDWEAPEERVRGRVLLPVLGDHYGRVLEAGELVPEREGRTFRVRYHEHVVPLSPESVGELLMEAAADAGAAAAELARLGRAFRGLPRGTGPGFRHRRSRYLEALRLRLDEALEDARVAGAVDRLLERLRGDHDALDALLEAQHYRLAYWRAGFRDLAHRRFFDIDTLVGVRVEDPAVFELTHRRVLDWLGDGSLGGVRVDHPDGLREPRAYLRRLREAAPHAWIGVEKILEAGEALRDDWPVDGTTGYDALNQVLGVFVDPAGEEAFSALYRERTGESTDWEAVAYARKHQVLREVLAADVVRLVHRFLAVCEGRRRYRDFTRDELEQALKEALASFPVYRTYVSVEGEAAPEDRAVIGEAVARARTARPDLDPELFDLLEAILLGEAGGEAERDLRMRVQQLTGPVMAKAVEDTAFYAYARFVALNEVGGDPGRFGLAPAAFHAWAARRAERWPRTMNALSSHDTKRSEDVRARLALLSEIPEWWGTAVRRLRSLAGSHRSDGLPDANTEYLLLQTLVGAWPISAERAAAYMEKASREAKTRTSWTDPVPEFDDALRGFVEGALADEAFAEALEEVVAPLVRPGRSTSLAMKLVQLTLPGIPDVYQGTELWDLSLVDPDNRRPVDWRQRRRLLDEVRGWEAEAAGTDGPWPFLEAVASRWDEGLPKLWTVRRALELRCRRPRSFAGSYRGLDAVGPAAAHLLAFRRGDDVMVAVPRLVMGLEDAGWGDTRLPLPEGRWRSTLTGEAWEGDVAAARLLGAFPVALLEREADP